MKFLSEIAKVFYDSESERLHKYCFVFPNRRAGVFFQKYLGEYAGKAIFSPRITSIKDLFLELSGLKEANRPDLLSRLYRLYCQRSGVAESFDEFVYWGEIVLSDFDDVDKYLVNASMLFNNVKDLKEIESDYAFLSEQQREAIRSFWGSFLPVEDNDKKLKFKALWELLSPLYADLKAELEAEKLAYEGMVFRKVADSLDQIGLEEYCNDYHEFVFIGFNALNSCEYKFLKRLQLLGKADFYWDFYGDMVTDSNNRSSTFLKNNITIFPSKRPITFDRSKAPEIEVITVSSAVGEAKIVSELLKSKVITSDIKTAIVLPDEKMLMPLLYSIPQEVDKVNVTMGYPLKNSPIVALLEHLIELRSGRDLSKKGYYYKKVIPILENPYIRNIAKESAEKVRNEIKKYNKVYVAETLLTTEPDLKEIFADIHEKSYTEYLTGVLDRLLEKKKSAMGMIEREHLYTLYRLIISLGNLKEEMSGSTYLKLLSQMIATSSIPFKGEPLMGLQIMGVLETRALDFDNVVICSMNEGSFPKPALTNTFIPQNLRRGFGLPDITFQDSIEAYYFYRLIGRVKRLFLICDSRTEGIQSGEQSRYIYQLKYHYKLPITERVVTYNIRQTDKKEIIIDKNCIPEEEKMPSKLSPSALQTYITCPLKFYFQYVKKVRQEDNLSEEVEANTFGTIFHQSMQAIYSPFIGKVVTLSDLKNLLADKSIIRSVVEKEFIEAQKVREITGYYLIVLEVIIRYIEEVIRFDLTKVPFTYLKSEEPKNYTIEYDSGKFIEFAGIIDRIDHRSYPEYGMLHCVIDYKTGAGDSSSIELTKDKNLSLLFSPPEDKNFSITLQMYLYAMMLSGDKPVVIAPYILRTLFSSGGKSLESIVSVEEISMFKILLKQKLGEIYNKEIPFVQTADRKRCKYCDFNLICN